MERIGSEYRMITYPKAHPNAVISGDKYRFTVLTPQMIRLEYSASGNFEDRATQVVINRQFDVPEYRVIEKEDSLEIITSHLHLTYDKKPFSKNGLSIQVKGNISHYRSIWHYGEAYSNLKGTARTLDETNGEIPLGDGLLSRNGFSVIDDSKSLLIDEDGWVSPRNEECVDLYFLGYGRNYLSCLKDFFKLCGPTPMLPRYALGNWWSRYYAYTESSYKELMMSFKREGIPFSVGVLDMDWHLVDIDPKYGTGWTGYTWNREYFPDPKAFLSWLHEQGLHVTMNLHPADGVRAHEEMYPEMAKALNVDTANEDKIPFDVTNPEFMKAYFKYLHHPNEDIGVDFWWIDWQQGTTSKIEGLDPLWMLNHFHFLDNKRRGMRPLIFSRYAGIGSHRYPIGFSGDTYATWETLDFQPYFTANASNVGYGWWSHDIGGHMHGIKDDELAARWLQFGVFSPIMRIHSSDNPFNVKEPWQYNLVVENTMKKFLRLRHQLIPYLYTMNRRCHVEGEPLIQPMYYRHPEQGEAYEVRNQYYFGTSLVVCPITKPMDKKLTLGQVKVWLPEGIYFDFFTGRAYSGGRRIDLYRDITTLPVLAEAGAIIPMAAESAVQNATDNPKDMEIRIFAGKDGEFTLYEDNSLTHTEKDLGEALTAIKFIWGKRVRFIIKGYQGDGGVIPEWRSYTLKFVGFSGIENITVYSDAIPVDYKAAYNADTKTLELIAEAVETSRGMTVSFECTGEVAGNHIEKEIFDLLNKAQIEFDLKSTVFQCIKKHKDRVRMLSELKALELESGLLGALYEIITAF